MPRPSEAQTGKGRNFFMSILPGTTEHQGFDLELGQILCRRASLSCAWLLPPCISPKHPHRMYQCLYFCRVCFPSLRSPCPSFFQVFPHIHIPFLNQPSLTTPIIILISCLHYVLFPSSVGSSVTLPESASPRHGPGLTYSSLKTLTLCIG